MKTSEALVRKFIIPGLLVLFLAVSCGDVMQYAPGPVEYTDGAAVDDSDYPFETPADYTGFTIYGVSDNLRFTSAVVSGEKAYKGSASLKVGVNYNAAESGGVLSTEGIDIHLAGQKLTARVWIPNGMFPADYSYGASFFFQLPNHNWYQSTWQNLSAPKGAVAGQWNTITANVDEMVFDSKTLAENSADGNTVVKWGLKVGQGGKSPNYTGFIYIDSISIEPAE